MAKIRLKKSSVVFNEAPHTYELDGKFLKGVTQILHEQPMFEDMYATNAFKALRENRVWKESGLSIKDTYNVVGDTYVPVPFSDQIFICTNEESEELERLYGQAQFEEMRIEANKKRAAIRGKAVHDACDKIDEGKRTDNEDAMMHAEKYKKLREAIGMEPLASEYLVSDNNFVASQIDLVWTDADNNISIADIKCVSRMDDTYILYLQWQLSIYKYLFELQNPSKKVKGIYGVWLPQKECYGTARIFELTPIPSDEVKILLEKAEKGEKYYPAERFELPAEISNNFTEYYEAKMKIKEYGEKVKELEKITKAYEKSLLTLFEDNDVKKWDFQGASFTRVLPSTKQSIDSDKLKQEYPDVYELCIKTTTTNSSLRVTLK